MMARGTSRRTTSDVKEHPGIPDTSESPIKSFADLGALPATLTSLARAGIEHPFPIQTLCLPLALSGVDLIGQARTGTGKTLAFGIPVVQTVDVAEPAVQALVVTPTRELCLQVAEGVAAAGADAGVTVVPVVGGRPIGPQIVALSKGPQVVVGTPGRLLDHLRQRTLSLSSVQVVVLDEADEMLDLGFLPDVEQILNATPSHRQTMLFSATMPTEVVGLARRYMRQPTFVQAQTDDASPLVPATEQYFFQVHPLDRFQVLCRMLDTPKRERVAVFRRTKRGVDRTISGLKELGYKAGALHGDMPQHHREKVLTQFRKGKLDVLVSTDVAARGLDIAGLSHVINYDTPEDEKAYVHRIGRTGRAGAAGIAITFVAWNERMTADLIRERLKLDHVPVQEVYSTSPLLVELFGMPAAEEAAATRNGDGKSKGNGGVASANGDGRRRRSQKAVQGARRGAAHGGEAVAEPRAAQTVRRRRRRGFNGVETEPAAQSAQSA